MDKSDDFLAEVAKISGLSAEELNPVSAQDQEMLYSAAFSTYEKGDYATAIDLFTQLALTNPFAEHYWRGLAASRQMTSEPMGALQAWALVSLLNEKDPLPHLHAGECYLALNQREDAFKALNIALERCGENQPLRDKIIVLLKQQDAHVIN